MNRCEQARQVHRFADHYQLAHGFYVEKCIGCGLTRAEVKDWRESRRGYAHDDCDDTCQAKAIQQAVTALLDGQGDSSG